MEQVKLRSLWLIPLCLLIAFGPWDSVSLLESMLPWALFGYGVELPARAIATWRPDRIVCALRLPAPRRGGIAALSGVRP